LQDVHRSEFEPLTPEESPKFLLRGRDLGVRVSDTAHYSDEVAVLVRAVHCLPALEDLPNGPLDVLAGSDAVHHALL